MTKLKKNLLVAAVVVVALAAALGSFLAFAPTSSESSPLAGAKPAADAKPLRADSHRLTEPEKSELTLVEFLDFECEACGAVHPTVEKLREEYGDRVTFVARYFPMPGHRNGQPAALAAEAAAQQGEFEEMYAKLFATQKEWGEQQESKAELFRSFAEELGLDMAEYDAAVKAPATAERVRKDQEDGIGLGVQGTPTFFLEGQPIETPPTYEAFKKLLDEELAG